MTRLRVGLALASGGAAGVWWELGALEAIRRVTGFTPLDAELVVGTSAGAYVGAMAMSRVGAPCAFTRVSGMPAPGLSFTDADLARSRAIGGHLMGTLLEQFPLARLPRPRPASLAGLVHLVRGGSRGVAVDAASLLPEGFLSTRKIGDSLREAWPTGWPSDKLRVTTFDLASATPLVLSASFDLGLGIAGAVSASCAAPGIFAPVPVGSRRLADGAIWSAASLGVLAGRGLDVVVCLHPHLGERTGRRRSLLGATIQRRIETQLDEERSVLERQGTRVFVLTPEASERAAMPRTLPDAEARAGIVSRAVTAVERGLRTASHADLAHALAPAVATRAA